MNEFIRTEYLQPEVELTYLEQDGDDPAPPPNAPGDKYVGLDQFNRVRDQRWLQGVTPLERVQYTFDRNSNRVSRGNRVAQGYAAKQDEYYTYDALNQLTQLQRGTLTYDGSGAVTGITPDSWQEDFTLDPTGNWNEYTNPDLGTQERTHDAANEIVEIDEDDAFVSHDAAGNMTKTPKPSDWEAAFDLTYDAWNRLVQVDAGDVAIYAYDGLNRRTTKTIDETVRHFYYSDQWQVLEERLDEETSADRQFVWGRRYRDDLVLRDRTTEENLDERIYVLHDFFHPTTLVDNEGDVIQRMGYDAYGTSRLMLPNFGSSAPDDYEWETRFAGYRWDGESELYQVRFRCLHSGLGRWTQRDPTEYVDGPNLYGYVGENPICFIDDSGQATKSNGDKDCEALCSAYEEEHRDDPEWEAGGTCVCKGKKKCPCTWGRPGFPPVGACDELDSCAVAHEAKHCSSTWAFCDMSDGCSVGSMGYPTRHRLNRDECQFRLQESQCLIPRFAAASPSCQMGILMRLAEITRDLQEPTCRIFGPNPPNPNPL